MSPAEFTADTARQAAFSGPRNNLIFFGMKT